MTEAEGVARVYSRWEQVLEGSAGQWLRPLTGTTTWPASCTEYLIRRQALAAFIYLAKTCSRGQTLYGVLPLLQPPRMFDALQAAKHAWSGFSVQQPAAHIAGHMLSTRVHCVVAAVVLGCCRLLA